jgi:leader peptidase (prepilin peptidase)/N-methyltransferase
MVLGTAYFSVVSLLFGLVIGSFLNVVAYRLPLKKSIVRPGSSCPHCGHAIRWYHNIPVVGWLILHGRCRDCAARISWRYPLVEALTGGLFAAAYLVYGLGGRLLLAWAFMAAMIAIVLIDLDYQIIPDKIVLPGAAVGLAASIALRPAGWWEYLVAAAGAAGFLFVIALIWAGGMGFGDVKMALLMGAVLGRSVIVAMFLAFLIGGVLGVVLIATKARSRKDRIPFGPFLAAGSIIALFYGQGILDLYLRLF